MDNMFDDQQYLQRVKDDKVEIAVPAEGLECFVVEGSVLCELSDGGIELQELDWLRLPASSGVLKMTSNADEGAIVLIRENTLRSAFAHL